MTSWRPDRCRSSCFEIGHQKIAHHQNQGTVAQNAFRVEKGRAQIAFLVLQRLIQEMRWVTSTWERDRAGGRYSPAVSLKNMAPDVVAGTDSASPTSAVRSAYISILRFLPIPKREEPLTSMRSRISSSRSSSKTFTVARPVRR